MPNTEFNTTGTSPIKVEETRESKSMNVGKVNWSICSIAVIVVQYKLLKGAEMDCGVRR